MYAPRSRGVTVAGSGFSAQAGRPVTAAVADDKGAVAGDDLAKILTWAGAFDRARAGKAADAPAPKGDGHAH